MSEYRDENERKRLENELLEKEANRLKEQAEEEARRRRAAAAAAAAAERARQAAAVQQKNKPQPKPKPEEILPVVFSPELSSLKPPAPGTRPRPEPDFIKKFRDILEEEKKQSMHYDHNSGRLIFIGNNGLDALIKFLEENPGVKITLDVGRDMLKDALSALKARNYQAGTLLDKLSGIEMDGKLIEGGKMSKLIQEKVGSPRPSPATGME